MKNYRSLKGQNRGASLIAVITSIVFVGIIGVVITQLTITNIQMKDMEQQGKTNFYSAEEAMDDLAAGLNIQAATQMQKAYLEILSKYRTVTASEESLQTIFKKMYIENLAEYFCASEADGTPMMKKSSSGMYQVGNYDISKIRSCFSIEAYKMDPSADGAINVLTVEAADGTVNVSKSNFRADLTNGRFVLEDIEVTVSDPSNPSYTTTIHTDIVFHTPNLKFDEGNIIREFMRYSLVANKDIKVDVANVVVDGNVYAGPGGIFGIGNSEAAFVGNTVITRGDVYVEPGAELSFGDSTGTPKPVNLWAENIMTKSVGGNTTASRLNIYGSAYIADDLEMNGKNGEITLRGNYYGYNFRKSYNNNEGSNAAGPDFSSTIAINAIDSKLDISGLDSLWLAGRAYLTKDTNGRADVLLGESVSVRSNQIAYYIPDKFLTDAASDPGSSIEKKKFADGTGADFTAYLGIDDITRYVNKDDAAIVYYFQEIGGGPGKMCFMKFSSDQAANDFFAEFYSKNKNRVDGFAGRYLASGALKMGDTARTLKGDMLYRDSADALQVTKQTIINEQWQPDGGMYERAAMWNAKYKSMQLYLDDNREETTTDRLIDKNDSPMFNQLINEAEFNKVFDSSAGDPNVREVLNDTADGSANGERNAVILVREQNETDIYELAADVKGGLIIANCNVRVQAEFHGLIIAKGEISFMNGARVSADEVLVSQLFSDDLIRSYRLFTQVFKGYEILNDENIGTVNVNKYLTYDNWSKTIK